MTTTISLRQELAAAGLGDEYSDEELQRALTVASMRKELGTVARAYTDEELAEAVQDAVDAASDSVINVAAPQVHVPLDEVSKGLVGLVEALGKAQAPQVHVPLEEVSRGLQGLVEAIRQAQAPQVNPVIDVNKGLQGLVEAIGKVQSPHVHNAPVINVPLEEVSRALGGIVRAVERGRRPLVTVEPANHKVYVPMAAVAKAISDLADAFRQMPAPVVHVSVPRIKRTTTAHKRDGAGELMSSVTEYVYED